MSTTSVPALDRFKRVMVSNRNDTCGFCGQPTYADTDYAVLDRKWFGCCAACAASVVAQCKALVNRIVAAADSYNLTTADRDHVNSFVPDNLVAVLNGEVADQYLCEVVAIKLGDALSAVETFAPEHPLLAPLRAVRESRTATAWERDFATSLARQIEDGRTLSDKQIATANRLVKTATVKVTKAEVTCTPEHGHTYVLDGAIYTVVASKAGRLYCKVLDAPVEGVKPSWSYASGAINRLPHGGRPITAEEAKGIGAVTGFCCFCSLELTDARSVTAGYGPTCADNNGLPWG